MQNDSSSTDPENAVERPPIFGSWNRVYFVLVAVLVAVIVSLYFFSKHFS